MKSRGDPRSTKRGGNVSLVARGGVARCQVVLFYWRVNRKKIMFLFSFRVPFGYFSFSCLVGRDFGVGTVASIVEFEGQQGHCESPT